jgi:hypothetical protein
MTPSRADPVVAVAEVVAWVVAAVAWEDAVALEVQPVASHLQPVAAHSRLVEIWVVDLIPVQVVSAVADLKALAQVVSVALARAALVLAVLDDLVVLWQVVALQPDN